MKPGINWRLVRSLLRRDLVMYFSSPTGYVFITLFIFLSAAAAFWQERFFLDNLANLDQLNAVFPWLLLLFVPALTMNVWAEERRQGTDELLLTLPATDLEVVLGKYLSALGIYSASLALSFSHVLVLYWLGPSDAMLRAFPNPIQMLQALPQYVMTGGPDPGLMLGNFLGYWLIGAALISVGMLASLMTANATIAFILGALLCSLFVTLDSVAGLFSRELGRLLAPLGVAGHFGDFARGVVTLSALLYFLSVAGFALYLNVLLIGRRHWPLRADGRPMWQHQLVRAVAIAVALVSLTALLGRARLRLDVTAEQLHSLSPETRRLVGELSPERPVFIQAFVSPRVPEPLVQTRADLLSLLREIDALAGPRVEVLVRETEPFSDAAREARERFGIAPRPVPDAGGARAGLQEVFLGVAFTCGAEEQVIPFFERGYPAEYELTRSIRVVARTERRKVGVVNTAINLFGGMDFQTMRSTPPWPVVEELRRQYEVVQVAPGAIASQPVDALLVALPSSLAQPDMDALAEVVESGVPTLLLVDPLPVVNIGLSPSEQPGASQNPFMRQQGPPPTPKGDIAGLMSRLGVSWDPAAIVWDSYNPHPDLATLPSEIVFAGRGSGNAAAFDISLPVSSELQELVLLYPGYLEAAAGAKTRFTPLVASGPVSGRIYYPQLVQRSFFGVQMNPNPRRSQDAQSYVLAALVEGEAAPGGAPAPATPAVPDPEGEADAAAVATPAAAKRPLRLAVIADLDFISEQFFQIRAAGPANLNFDNVTFFMNTIDTLLGDDSFVALRNRRVRHRTLERVEAQTRNFLEQRSADEKQAEQAAEAALKAAQQRLDEKVESVRQRTDLDSQTKQIMARNLQEVENKRFETLKAGIEAKKEVEIRRSEEKVEEQVRRIQSGIRTFAVLLPPIPVFVIGVLIFVRRQRREREGAAAARRLRS